MKTENDKKYIEILNFISKLEDDLHEFEDVVLHFNPASSSNTQDDTVKYQTSLYMLRDLPNIINQYKMSLPQTKEQKKKQAENVRAALDRAVKRLPTSKSKNKNKKEFIGMDDDDPWKFKD